MSFIFMNLKNIHFLSECPAFTVEGSIQESWDASPTGTTATIECAVTHSLVGTSTLTCQEGGSWSNDVPQCDESKYVTIHYISIA